MELGPQLYLPLGMTDHNIKEKNIQGQQAMNAEVVKNSKATRDTLLTRGIKPELIKPEEDLKHIESRRKKEAKELQKSQSNDLIEEQHGK